VASGFSLKKHRVAAFGSIVASGFSLKKHRVVAFGSIVASGFSRKEPILLVRHRCIRTRDTWTRSITAVSIDIF
jgi:hypothetical protein